VLGHLGAALVPGPDQVQVGARPGPVQQPGHVRRAADIETAVDQRTPNPGQPRDAAQQLPSSSQAAWAK
jgi:hypothetical protein